MSVSNANAGRNGLSPAIELMRKATEQAADEAMEDQFVSFLEDCVSGAASPRNGYYERKVLAGAGEINAHVPRARLAIHSLRNGRRLIAVEAEGGSFMVMTIGEECFAGNQTIASAEVPDAESLRPSSTMRNRLPR